MSMSHAMVSGPWGRKRTRRERAISWWCRIAGHRWAEGVRGPDGPLVSHECRNGCGGRKCWTVY